MNAKAFLCVKPYLVVSRFWSPALGHQEELKPDWCFSFWIFLDSVYVCSLLSSCYALCWTSLLLLVVNRWCGTSCFLCVHKGTDCAYLIHYVVLLLEPYEQVIYLNVIVKFMHLIINDAWLHMTTCFSSTPTLRILEADCKTFLFFLFNDLPLIRRVMFIQGNIYQNFYACTFF